MQTKEGQPVVGSPCTNARTIINNIAINEPAHDKAPTKEAIFNGASEKFTIPSMEYLNKLQKDQDVSPATRSRFSKERYLVLNGEF